MEAPSLYLFPGRTQDKPIEQTVLHAASQSPPAQRRGTKKGCLDQAVGGSRGGLTTKIHVVVNVLGTPLALSLTGGQAHDNTKAEALVAKVEPEAVLAEKGYDSDGFVAVLELRDSQAIISPKGNRKAKREWDLWGVRPNI